MRITLTGLEPCDEDTAVSVRPARKARPLTVTLMQEFVAEAISKGTPLSEGQLLNEANGAYVRKVGPYDFTGRDRDTLRAALAVQMEAGIVREHSPGVYASSFVPMVVAGDDEDSALAVSGDRPYVAEIDDLDTSTTGASVYVYYHRVDKLYAQKCGRSVWPCKIGFSEISAETRVKNQRNPALYEPLILAFKLEVGEGEARYFERILHSSFKIVNSWMPRFPGYGHEFFVTYPDEVRRLFETNILWRREALKIDRSWPPE